MTKPAAIAAADSAVSALGRCLPTFGILVAMASSTPTPTSSATSIFHLAYHVEDLARTRAFYGGVLGCREGRSTDTWVDFDFFGHQLSLHLGKPFATTRTGRVGEHMVPMPHLGLVLQLDSWHALAKRLETAGIEWVIPPQVRYRGEPGEQWTMFFCDPFGNPIEIKGFADLAGLYAT